MGQKTNPIGNRLGFIRGWESNWYGGKDFGDKLAEDNKIRVYLKVRLSKASVSKIAIERTLKLITITIHTARPGIIIGKGGQEVETLKEELKKITKKDIQINIFEIKRPELEAEMARSEMYKDGRTPLHTFRADIDYSISEASTTYGKIGVKVWICRGEVYGKRDLMLHFKTPNKKESKFNRRK